MISETIQQSVLQLSVKDRAALAQILLESLDDLSKAESEELWLNEAKRRSEEIDQGKVQLIDGEEFEKQVQALFK